MSQRTLIIVLLFVFGVVLSVVVPRTDAKPIVMGAPCSLGFSEGRSCANAIELAVEEINEKGGVSVGGVKRPFKLEILDTRDLEPGVPTSEALLAVEKLILQKKADVLIGGPNRSEAALATLDLIAKYKKPWIVTSGTYTPKLTAIIGKKREKYRHCFRTHGNVMNIFHTMIPFAQEVNAKHGLNSFFQIVQDVSWARAAGGALAKMLPPKGFENKGMEVLPTGATEFAPALLKIKKNGAHLLFFWADMPQTIIMLKLWSDMKIKAWPIGYSGALHAPGVWKASEGKIAYVLSYEVTAGSSQGKLGPWQEQFYKAYTKKMGYEPESHGPSSSYMVVYIMADAIERAGKMDADAIAAAIEKTDMMGIYGRMRFDEKHEIIFGTDPAEGAVTGVVQFLEGKRVTIDPAKIAFRPYSLPPWMKE